MLINIVSLIAGFILAEPLIGKIEALKEGAQKLHTALLPYQMAIGIVEFVLGVVALLNRLQITNVGYFYSGFPTVIVALVMGLLLAEEIFRKVSWGARAIEAVKPYQEYVGLVGIVVGLRFIY